MTSIEQLPAPGLVDRLHALYRDSSKHSVYQSVPAFMARKLGYQEEIHSLWRSDKPRYDYIVARLDLARGATVADIGANTGFFSLNLAHARPELRIDAFEMNPRHAEFIALAAEAFDLPISVRSQSCDLGGIGRLPGFDVVILLNVLHHAGFDFDAHLADDNGTFEAYAVDYLSTLRTRTRRLVFQIGSNRGGDKQRPLFSRDDDAKRLAWISRTLRSAGWRIDAIGYAQLEHDVVQFHDAPADVLAAARVGEVESPEIAGRLAALRLDRFPGEFHRRPLVIATSEEA
jgi:SAM-dependent methyltransferase